VPLSRILARYTSWYNQRNTFWYFTKAHVVNQSTLVDVAHYHEVLKKEVIDKRKPWTPQTQQTFASMVAPGSNAAWARELKVLFNLLGTAWVENATRVKVTTVGEEFLANTNPEHRMELLARQVRKYQIGNPQLSEKLVKDMTVIPHQVLLQVLLETHPLPITANEFTYFISRVADAEDLGRIREALTAYRSATSQEQMEFAAQLDQSLVTKIRRIFSYAANFLTIPPYLSYTTGQITVHDYDMAKKVLTWYDRGHDQHISFKSDKDWFSYYGDTQTTSSPLDAVEYFRKVGDAKPAAQAYRRAIEKGMLSPEEDAIEFECRVQGEAKLEEWLGGNLDKLEAGLTLIDEGRQYETEDAGRIDLLTRDSKSQFVVVELKRDKVSDVALGQLLRYIGWVRLNLCSDPQNERVRGYLVGDRFDDKLQYALLSNSALEEMCRLKEYATLGVRLEITKSENECTATVVEVEA